MASEVPPKALTIAGSDSGGGAGIQADLKTFMALGVYGTSVITSLTAQNSLGVAAISTLEPEFVLQQYEAVMSDIGADAAKIGMLADARTIEAVAEALNRRPIENLVLDPVMVAGSGDRLLDASAVSALRELLLPKALLVTPNLPEAEILTGLDLKEPESREDAARKILAMGPKAVLIKGGHGGSGSQVIDLYCQDNILDELKAARIDTAHTHGSGCTLSAAITAFLARGFPLGEAIREAKEYVTEAIKRAFPVGKGPGPLHHGFAVPAYPGEGPFRSEKAT